MIKDAPRIKKILGTDLEGFHVSLLFTDGYRGTVNLSDIFQKPTAEIVEEILRGNLFSRCFVESGALAWPNGLELCPYALRMQLETQRKRARHPGARKRKPRAA